MSEVPITVKRPVVKYGSNNFTSEQDEIAVEYPLTVYVNDQEFATIMCTPDHIEEMVIGFLASESLIRNYEEIDQLILDYDKGLCYVDLFHKSSLDPSLFSKRRISSCCGKSRQSFYFLSDEQTAHQVQSRLTVTTSQCFNLMNGLHASSIIHRNTGGVHNAAICTADEIIVTYSDIGRHNALDKLYGHCLKYSINTADKLLVISGRISSEMLLKAAKIGCGILLSKSAPTELALQLAEELEITAVGFIRNSSMNVYTHYDRILADASL